jgi:hypothetical protein
MKKLKNKRTLGSVNIYISRAGCLLQYRYATTKHGRTDQSAISFPRYPESNTEEPPVRTALIWSLKGSVRRPDTEAQDQLLQIARANLETRRPVSETHAGGRSPCGVEAGAPTTREVHTLIACLKVGSSCCITGGGLIMCAASSDTFSALTQPENPFRHTRTSLASETRDKTAVRSARDRGPTDLSPSE